MNISFIAQSGFIIQTQNKTIGIDLRLDNPVNPIHIDEIPILDYSCCTHDHGDHGYETMMQLARRDDALFLSGYEMMKVARAQGCRTEQASV
jgi:L-ascorbate metabolism protein UlaG (beta-lactamase superfamily)